MPCTWAGADVFAEPASLDVLAIAELAQGNASAMGYNAIRRILKK
jgi:hypothetical protein